MTPSQGPGRETLMNVVEGVVVDGFLVDGFLVEGFVVEGFVVEGFVVETGVVEAIVVEAGVAVIVAIIKRQEENRILRATPTQKAC